MGVLVEDRPLVDVAQRPVIVAFGDKVIDRAGRIVRVISHAAHTGVENADIEYIVNGLRIRGGEVVGDIALPEALTVKRDISSSSMNVSGLRAGNTLTPSGKYETSGDLAFCIVVAVEDESRDVRFREAAHLTGEE